MICFSSDHYSVDVRFVLKHFVGSKHFLATILDVGCACDMLFQKFGAVLNVISTFLLPLIDENHVQYHKKYQVVLNWQNKFDVRNEQKKCKSTNPEEYVSPVRKVGLVCKLGSHTVGSHLQRFVDATVGNKQLQRCLKPQYRQSSI